MLTLKQKKQWSFFFFSFCFDNLFDSNLTYLIYLDFFCLQFADIHLKIRVFTFLAILISKVWTYFITFGGSVKLSTNTDNYFFLFLSILSWYYVYINIILTCKYWSSLIKPFSGAAQPSASTCTHCKSISVISIPWINHIHIYILNY